MFSVEFYTCRMMPKDYPNWSSCYYYFRRWSKKKDLKSESVFEEVFKKLVQKVRILDNRKEKTTFTIIDAQSVKNTDTDKNKGYDAGKKVSGIKRHIAVDSNGLPHLCMLLRLM